MIAETKTKGALSKSTRANATRTDIVRSRQPVDDTDAEAREIQDEIKQLHDERLQDELQIHRIPITQLERHPDNRKIDPKDPGIIELGQSIVAHGQLDPLRVRPIVSGGYQIISGERRFTAMQVAGVALARCVVVDLSDADALCEVAIANSNREDLNPIQRAELMQRLMQPRDQGGSGLSLVEAGKRFGLNSESGCKNALRMLKLPPKIRELVVSGHLPERVARRLIPYMVNDQIAKAIADDLTHEFCGDENMVALWSGEVSWIEDTIMTDDMARPLSKDVMFRYSYPKGEHPALFDWESDSKLIEQLKVVELPWSIDYDAKARKDRVEPRKFATNVKLWHKLNDPLVDQAIEAGKKVGRNKPSGAVTAPAKKQTPAQIAAEAKARAAEADRRLDTFSAEWLDRLLRCSLADRSTDDCLVALTLPWIVGQCPSHDLRTAHDQALVECQIESPKPKGKSKSKGWQPPPDTLELLPIVASPRINSGGEVVREYDVMSAFWRILLWPVTRLIGDAAERSELTPSGQLPDKITQIGGYMNDDTIIQLAALAKVSAETAWRDGATDGTDQRRLIIVWLCRHTKDQLHKLRSELHVTEGSSTMGRDELAGCVLNAHRPGRPLPLPKRLQSIK